MLIMGFVAQKCPDEAVPSVSERSSDALWRPMFSHSCSFPPEIFRQVMLNLLRNPNIHSNHLFRADTLLDKLSTDIEVSDRDAARLLEVESFDLTTVMVTRLIPRNLHKDKAMEQTSMFFEGGHGDESMSLVLYVPHIATPDDCPYYYPAVRGIGFLHAFNNATQIGTISVHYSFFDFASRTPVLERTAQHLLAPIHKHGQGLLAGYQKRVHHDEIIPQARLQDTYSRLKRTHAKRLIDSWVEVTDPGKHVFEDLGIAAFLIELWADMYAAPKDFPGFVDIGCGNGLLVHILLEEGYSGWGFDARKRKSWDTYSTKTQPNLKELVLLPSIIRSSTPIDSKEAANGIVATPGIHDGAFPTGTFIISNHADELTPWTPILATISQCPFLAIPCCSHNLAGAKFRAQAKSEAGIANTAFAALVAWVTKLSEDCGWKIEKEMLRIPSTRNTALVGKTRAVDYDTVDVAAIITKYGSAQGWEENAMKLIKGGPRGH